MSSRKNCYRIDALKREGADLRRAFPSSAPRLRSSHPDLEFLEGLDSRKLSLESFEPISLFAPSLRVDTTDGYDPDLDQVIDFVYRGDPP